MVKQISNCSIVYVNDENDKCRYYVSLESLICVVLVSVTGSRYLA